MVGFCAEAFSPRGGMAEEELTCLCEELTASEDMKRIFPHLISYNEINQERKI